MQNKTKQKKILLTETPLQCLYLKASAVWLSSGFFLPFQTPQAVEVPSLCSSGIWGCYCRWLLPCYRNEGPGI